MKRVLFCLLVLCSICPKICANDSDEVIINVSISVPKKTIKQFAAKKKISLSALRKYCLDNFSKWEQQGTYITTTCQAVTPPGKYIGNFDNPKYKGQSIPGGQSTTCNLWLVEKKDHSKKSNLKL